MARVIHGLQRASRGWKWRDLLIIAMLVIQLAVRFTPHAI